MDHGVYTYIWSGFRVCEMPHPWQSHLGTDKKVILHKTCILIITYQVSFTRCHLPSFTYRLHLLKGHLPSGSTLPSLSGTVKTPVMVWPSLLNSWYTSAANWLWPMTAIRMRFHPAWRHHKQTGQRHRRREGEVGSGRYAGSNVYQSHIFGGHNWTPSVQPVYKLYMCFLGQKLTINTHVTLHCIHTHF